jgi:protein TonB
VDDPDDVTIFGFHRIPAMAVATSALLHATVAVAMALPSEQPLQQTRISERAIEVTLDLPTPPIEEPATAAANQAALKLTPGSAELVQTATAPGPQDAAAAPPPVPAKPDVALILPSNEPPPAISTRDFGNSASPPAPELNLEIILPPVEAPPPIAGRDFAMTAPPALAKSPSVQERIQAPPPQQPIRQAAPRQASQQHVAEKSDGRAQDAPSPSTKTATNSSSQPAQRDYLWQIIRKLSQSRFYPQSREANERGVVVARLTVARDGRLIDVSLAKSSGFPNLDRGVIDTIRRASPFAPLPAEIAVDSHMFIVPINYER